MRFSNPEKIADEQIIAENIRGIEIIWQICVLDLYNIFDYSLVDKLIDKIIFYIK